MMESLKQTWERLTESKKAQQKKPAVVEDPRPDLDYLRGSIRMTTRKGKKPTPIMFPV